MIDADLTIAKIITEANSVKTICFSLKGLPAGQGLNQKPGQFASVQVPTPEGIQFRSFSISSSPLEQDHLDITVKRYEDSSAAKALHEMNEGQKLHVKAPFGMFILEDSVKNPVMIAGGNGVTPLMAMIRYIVGKKLPIKPILIYSNRTQSDIIFKGELEQYSRDRKIVADNTLTCEPAGTDWKGLSGRVDAAMIQKLARPLNEKTFFLCGPPEMVKTMHTILLGLNVAEEKIKTEQFIRPAKTMKNHASTKNEAGNAKS